MQKIISIYKMFCTIAFVFVEINFVVPHSILLIDFPDFSPIDWANSACVIFNTFSLRNNTRSLNSILLPLFFTWRRRKRYDWRFYFARRQEFLLYPRRSLEQRLYLLLPLLPLSQGAKKDFRYQPILYRPLYEQLSYFSKFWQLLYDFSI